MKTIPNRFDPETGRHSAQVPPGTLLAIYTDTELTIYEPGDKLPEQPPDASVPEPTIDEKIARLERALTTKATLAEIKAEIEKPITRDSAEAIEAQV